MFAEIHASWLISKVQVLQIQTQSTRVKFHSSAWSNKESPSRSTAAVKEKSRQILRGKVQQSSSSSANDGAKKKKKNREEKAD